MRNFLDAAILCPLGRCLLGLLLFSGPMAQGQMAVEAWVRRYDGPGNGWDRAYMVAVDKNGNAFVAGYSYIGPTGYDYATIAYSAAGVALWTNYYNGPNLTDVAYALAVDDAGNVFVTGESTDTDSDTDIATVAYSGAG